MGKWTIDGKLKKKGINITNNFLNNKSKII